MVTVVHQDTIIPVISTKIFQSSIWISLKLISGGKEHVHHNHISRSALNEHHGHDIHERKQMRSILEEAKAKFARMMHDEKMNVKYVKKGQPEAFHNMVFRLVQYVLFKTKNLKSSIKKEIWLFNPLSALLIGILSINSRDNCKINFSFHSNRSSEQANMRAIDLSHRALENVIASRLYKLRLLVTFKA